MTIPAPLPPGLASLLHARIDSAHVSPASGLVCLSFYAGRKILLGLGVGPFVVGLGLLPRLPRARTAASHPLIAALRAHFVDRHVTAIEIAPDSISLFVEPPPEEAAFTPRLFAVLGRNGHIELTLPSGASLVWPANNEAGLDPSSFFETLAEHGAAMVETSDARALAAEHAALSRALARELKKLERRREAVRQDLARLEHAPHYQKIGQLLVSQAHAIPKGARTATLMDWETGGTIDIELAPDKPAKLQAETFFQKARRLQRGAAVMQARLEATTAEIEKVKQLVLDCSTCCLDTASLESLAKRIHAANIPVQEVADPHAKSASPKQEKSAERKPFFTFLGVRERPILVGRGSKDNDALLKQFAKPHDLWLHAKNIHGAHVVVPLDKGENCPADLLVDAATLAAHFGDARGAPSCEVSYVERRYVRKPKKSAPGAVTLDREKVLALRVEPDRLARLLASKRNV